MRKTLELTNLTKKIHAESIAMTKDKFGLQEIVSPTEVILTIEPHLRRGCTNGWYDHSSINIQIPRVNLSKEEGITYLTVHETMHYLHHIKNPEIFEQQIRLTREEYHDSRMELLFETVAMLGCMQYFFRIEKINFYLERIKVGDGSFNFLFYPIVYKMFKEESNAFDITNMSLEEAMPILNEILSVSVSKIRKMEVA